jgi:hypothetical protein
VQTEKFSPRSAADTIEDTASAIENMLMDMPSTTRSFVGIVCGFSTSILMAIWSRRHKFQSQRDEITSNDFVFDEKRHEIALLRRNDGVVLAQ